MSAFQKNPAFDFKTQYHLGIDPQDNETVVDFFCGGVSASTRLEMGMGSSVTVAGLAWTNDPWRITEQQAKTA
ncbi:hypothetical protein KC131_23765 [Pseudomonas sp. JQ170]|uniref:hypothetical protein n=1 Tax=unclassified Pseudomonas TaxID=196821 RepID=UPI0026542DCC|nr:MULTISPECIES: hypothetical protein [unclassified Pseudomonas]MDN7143671.1 hypothetical protein [Pseudomonas sp. JQ170]WRO78890.1 hypothetical protein U9R80_16675 [Pseudomonas sp. 170C]